MAETGDRTYATVYTRSFLSVVYDYYVLGFNMKYIWGCSAKSILLPFFEQNFARKHLDVGVATGWFPAAALGRPFRSASKQQLMLMDLNPNPLRAAQARILACTSGTEVRCVEADATSPVGKGLEGQRFGSISMFNLFHCMPGGKEKLKAIGNMKEVLADDGVLAGCTVLGRTHSTSWLTTFYLKWYNDWWGVFNNWDDKREDFEEVLRKEFEEVETSVIGLTLLFRASKPRRAYGELLV